MVCSIKGDRWEKGGWINQLSVNLKSQEMKFLLILFLFIPLQVVCRCYTPIQLDIRSYNEADLIFIGKLKQINNSRLLTYSFLFEVKKIYKGQEIYESINIKTNKWPTKEDGFYGEVGKTYIIVAYKCLMGYCTSQCNPNSVSGKYSSYLKDSLFLEFINLHKNSRIDSTMSKSITASGQLKNGLPDGPWTYYNNYNHGRPYAVGLYTNGKKDSIWNFFSDRIILKEQNTYGFLPNYISKDQRIWLGQEIYDKDKLKAQIFIEYSNYRNGTNIEIELYSKMGEIDFNDYEKIKGPVFIKVYKYTIFGREKTIKKIECLN